MLAEPARQTDFENVLIVDDHPLFCDALSMTLRSVAEIGEIHTADRLENAMELVAKGLKPDAVMLDLNLPDVDGLDGLLRVKSAADAPVIVVSSLTDNRVISQVIKAGASGYVPKHSQRDVFRTAFETVHAGGIFVPDGCVLIEDEEEDEHSDAVNRLAALTNQQGRIKLVQRFDGASQPRHNRHLRLYREIHLFQTMINMVGTQPAHQFLHQVLFFQGTGRADQCRHITLLVGGRL